LASTILGVGVLILDDRRIGVACSSISSSSGWLVIDLFFVAGFTLAVIFLLAFAVTALFCFGETMGVVFLGGARTGYLALKACTTSVAESSDAAISENYTVSTTVMLTRTVMLTWCPTTWYGSKNFVRESIYSIVLTPSGNVIVPGEFRVERPLCSTTNPCETRDVTSFATLSNCMSVHDILVSTVRDWSF
jgi:hypothetical protein